LKNQTKTKVNDSLAFKFHQIRKTTLDLCNHLEDEDFVVQSMPDVSPLKWHIAHTTWFFETFILQVLDKEFTPFDPHYHHLFNSYYQTVGEPFSRPNRGLLSRPPVKKIREYRRSVDDRIQQLLERQEKLKKSEQETLTRRLELGLNHEQQHQELMLTDIKHIFSQNPLTPVYSKCSQMLSDKSIKLAWIHCPGGLVEIGSKGESFTFDNEKPRHQVFLKPFTVANRLTTNREYLEFLEDGGYSRPELWLSDGWAAARQNNWNSPLYWHKDNGAWMQFTLMGLRNLVLDEPVCHVSYYEADAYARWKKVRLLREEEWETVAASQAIQGNFLENASFHPITASSNNNSSLSQLFGDVWEWTSSPYISYPGFQPLEGSLGEYNGKFMANQFVLKGGSCATPQSHIRATYRNFFYPHSRWQFSGIRLAKPLE